MTNTTKTNKLSIYLIKEEYSDIKDILKSSESLQSREVKGVGILYFDESHPFEPSWIKSFFGPGFDIPVLNSSSKAVFIVQAKIDKKKERIFAVPFGYGWSLMNEGVWEERFGLKVTLNTVDPKSLRAIEKQNLGSVPKHSTEQISRDGEVANFGIDIEQDLVKSVTGRSMSQVFGKTITGKDALSVSIKVDVLGIADFLQDCWDRYNSENYKQDFGFIDQIAEIRDPALISHLNKSMIANINTDNLEKTWMAVPQIIEWSDVKGFNYDGKDEGESRNDIHIREFIKSLPESKQNPVELATLKSCKVHCLGAAHDEVIHSWRAYDCLYCEITENKKVYLLSNGKWYRVERDFVDVVENDYAAIRQLPKSVLLPVYDHKDENAYNESVAAKDSAFCCMDQKNISHGGGYSKIEFCDLFSNNGKIVHVKHYAGSSVLSHLFYQGIVSGELFLADFEFRKKVNEKLLPSHKIDLKKQPVAGNYEIVFAVISSSHKALDLPFFSKVSLRNARRRLETFGYKVSFQKIDVAGKMKAIQA